jgi:hypothetical protein
MNAPEERSSGAFLDLVASRATDRDAGSLD